VAGCASLRLSLVPILFVIIVVVIVLEVLVDLLGLADGFFGVFFLFFVLFLVAFEFEWIESGNTQGAAAGIAIPRIASFHLLQIVVVDHDFGVTLRTGGHTLSFVRLNPIIATLAPMSVKTILVAHRFAAVRERFAAALADARHAYVMAGTDPAARAAAADTTRPVSLALVDLGLAPDGVAFVRALRESSGRPVPVVIFSGTVGSAAQVAQLSAMNIAGYINEHAATTQILPALAPHLFPDSFNRRASPRIALGVPVSYRAGQTIAGAVTLDVGKGGLAIRTMNPFPPGTTIQVKFRLPGGHADIDAVGRVAWSDRKVGMGVQFDRISAADQDAVDAFVDGHR
jgi:uncharacterized protein (TIGR02266 family)